jgi:methenyltetrahydrofolate cyclohydrolase
MSLTDKSVRDLLSAFSSPDPTPGGGSAAALASAVGASLLMMVAGLPKTRSGSDQDRAALAAAMHALTGTRQRLTEAVDADATAYNRVVSAYGLPKRTDEEKLLRQTEVQRAMRGATDVPLEVMRLSAEALEAAQAVATHGHQGAGSDVGVAVALLRSGLAGAGLNVDVNLTSVHDETYTREVSVEAERLARTGTASAQAAETALRA